MFGRGWLFGRGRNADPAESLDGEQPRVVVVDHHDSYTHNLVHLIGGVTGVLPDVVQHDEWHAMDLSGEYTHVVLSPGPGRPDELWDFLLGRDLLHAVAQGWGGFTQMKVWGVCLGMQGIVTSFGGRVDRVEPAHGEVATITHDGKGLFEGVPQGFDAVRYHSLAALEVPSDLLVTARAEDGTVMGVRHASLPIEGVQFHPESILSQHGALMAANFLRPVTS